MREFRAMVAMVLATAWLSAAAAGDSADPPPLERLDAAAVLADVEASREQARAANADRLFSERWQRVEAQRRELRTRIETEPDSRAVVAQRAAVVSAYQDLELEALQAALFSRARAEIAQARNDRVQRDAPKTLEHASALLATAEEALVENRHDLDLPRSLADEAAYTARYAARLATRVRRAESRGGSVEEALLEAHEPLRRAAAEAGLLPRFDAGPTPVGEQLVERLHELEDALRRSRNALEDANRRVQSLQEEIRELDLELGGVVRERSDLIQRLEARERVRGQFESLEALFARDEASVLREGNRVTIRLSGLNFATGDHEVPADADGLLERLSRVTNLFPRARLRIEGHTDSRGSDALNMRLSQRRADAVRDALIERFGLNARRVEAEGLGEHRPIASNETPEGRERNRRIDVTFEVDD